jgi:hypothetical protein
VSEWSFCSYKPGDGLFFIASINGTNFDLTRKQVKKKNNLQNKNNKRFQVLIQLGMLSTQIICVVHEVIRG